MNTRYLLIISIGPVQFFIRTARTARDLTFGSWMLSDLSKAVARFLYQRGAILVFPSPDNPDNDLAKDSAFSVSNQVLTIVDSEPNTLVKMAYNAVQLRLDDVFGAALGKTSVHLGEYLSNRAKRQVKDLVEFYWAAFPCEDCKDAEIYSLARNNALWALSLRKNTRNFQPWNGISGLPKSALDGFRDAIIVVKGTTNANAAKIRRYKKRSDVLIVNEKPPILREGEVLSGVDLLKRGGGYTLKPKTKTYEGVPSTSDLAAQPLVHRLGLEQAKKWRRRVVQLLQDEGIPEGQASSETLGVYFFPDRAADLITGQDKYERQRHLREMFEENWEQVLGKETPRPHPYYALLIADGDSMGELIDAQKSIEAHQTLSQRLAEFAKEAVNIIQRYQGYPIYTGGDDVLALLPLHTVLEALAELDTAFQNKMKRYPHPRTGKAPTLSGGLVIAHHLTPLEDVLATAREAEHRAKERPQKHGLGIVLLRRSGEVLRIRDEWPSLIENLRFWVSLRQMGAYPKGLPYDLRQLAEFLEPTDLNVNAYQAEVKRVFRLKRERKDETLWKVLETHVEGRFQGEEVEPAEALKQIAYEMLAAADIAEARSVAKEEAYAFRKPLEEAQA